MNKEYLDECFQNFSVYIVMYLINNVDSWVLIQASWIRNFEGKTQKYPFLTDFLDKYDADSLKPLSEKHCLKY